jgi:hypothetical protein
LSRGSRAFRDAQTRALALEEADEQKARYLREGGILIA